MPASVQQHRQSAGQHYNKTQRYAGPAQCQARADAMAAVPSNPVANARAQLMLLGLVFVGNVAASSRPVACVAPQSGNFDGPNLANNLSVSRLTQGDDERVDRHGDVGVECGRGDVQRTVGIALPSARLNTCERLEQDPIQIGPSSGREKRSPPSLRNDPRQEISECEVLEEGARSTIWGWLDQKLRWSDPLTFAGASASAIPTADAAISLRADLGNALRVIGDPPAKREFLHDIVAYLVAQNVLSVEQGDRLSRRLEPLLETGPICVHVVDPAHRPPHRNKRMSQTVADRAIADHIRENCAFEEEILDAHGRSEGEVLLFKAQRADNPFRSIYDGRPDHGPSPEARGVADGLNFLFGILTFGIGPGISSQVAHSYRNELYHQRGDEICKTRLQHLVLAETGTSLNVDNLGGGVFSRGRVPFVRPPELTGAHSLAPEASFLTRDPETGIFHGLRRRVFRSGGRPRIRHQNQDHLQIKRRGGEYFIHDRFKPHDSSHRVIVDEASGQWQYADELPPAAHESGMSILRRERKAFVMVRGREHELHWNFRDDRYEVVVATGGANEREYWPVYMEPLSKSWQPTSLNGRSAYSPEHREVIAQWSVGVAQENGYRRIENLHSSYYGNGVLFEVREPGHGYTNQAQYQVVEMNGKLVPARANIIPESGVSYEAYDLNVPGQPGRSIEWDGWQWVFEPSTSRQLPKKLWNAFGRVPAADVRSNDLSVPDSDGIRWSAVNRGYLKFDGRYVEIRKLGEASNRFYVERDDGRKLRLRVDEGEFRKETAAERLSVISDVGMGGRSSRPNAVSRRDAHIDEVLQEVELDAYQIPADARWAEVRLALRGGGESFQRVDDLETARMFDRFYEYCRRLREDANSFFGRLPRIANERMQSLDAGLDDAQVFEKLFSQKNGIVIGENHYEVEAKRLLIDNMHELKRQGVGTLYVEGLWADGHELDPYFLSPDAPMSQALKDELDQASIRAGTDPDGPYTFRKVIESARANGIQVKALECAASTYVPVINSGGIEQSVLSGERARTFNYFAGARIMKHQAATGNGRWVAFVGTTHANTNMRVPGLAELTDSIGVGITTQRSGEDVSARPEIRPGRRARDRAPAAELIAPFTDYVWKRPKHPLVEVERR